MMFKVLSLATALLLPMTTLAGEAFQVEVSITKNSDGSGKAQGSMSGARNAADNLQYIGCAARSYATGTGGTAYQGMCWAQDKNGGYAYCKTSSLSAMQPLQSLADHSFIRFSHDKYGVCTDITVEVSSNYLPAAAP